MQRCLYFTSALSAGFFCWAVFAINTAFGAPPADVTHGAGDFVNLNTHGEGHGHTAGGGGLPQLDASTFPSQLFWLLVTFVILYMIFSRKSLPEISGVIENRQQHIRDDLESAEKLKEEAEEAERAYEKSLIDARQKAASAIHDMQERMQAKAEKQSESFRAKAEDDIRNLQKNLDTAKKEAMGDMNIIAAEVASEAAQKIVGLNTDIEQAKTVVESLHANTNAKAA